ncbi:MAG: class I SAM-dependent DNA methyltransferase [Thermomicrobiales bacterium]
MNAHDPKRIVADGYDRIAERYSTWTGTELVGPRARYLAILQEQVPAAAAILELDCATGVPVTRALAARYNVTGVDLSPRQVGLARANVPTVTFIAADMTALELPAERFDAVVAFYAITHIPGAEHADLLAAIARWLRPGGLLVATLGAGDDPGTIEEDWLGTPMFFSSYDTPTNERFLTEAGFEIVSADEVTEDEDGVPVTFLWVVARKPLA